MSTKPLNEIRRLRAEYDGAFREWAKHVRYLLAIGEATPDRVRAAESRVAAAEAAYRKMRDRFIASVISHRAAQVACC
jgi:hypothetical protein